MRQPGIRAMQAALEPSKGSVLGSPVPGGAGVDRLAFFVERVDVEEDALEVRIRAEGLTSLLFRRHACKVPEPPAAVP